MKIAIIGSGITGLSCAWLLNHHGHDVTIFEKNNYIGGHSNTVEIPPHPAVDTGFIVYNENTYPNLIALFDLLGVKRIKTNMGFAVSIDQGRVEYSGDSIFAQKKNIFKPSFWQMLFDIIRFYKSAPKELLKPDSAETLADYLQNHKYSKEFMYDHLLPMAGSIWSMSAEDTARFPLKSFVQFFQNHGLFNLTNRPQWWTVSGGSREYVRIITKNFIDRIKLNTPVLNIIRGTNQSEIITEDGSEPFDHIVFATHSDQALNILGTNANPNEIGILSKIPYTENTAYLHQDESLMPQNKTIWSSWNYFADTNDGKVFVTYWMNNLQKFLPNDHSLFVSLNPITPPDPSKIIQKIIYEHPHFTETARIGWQEIHKLQGVQNTWFGGAWCGYGFHEDGITAGITIAELISGKKRPWDCIDKSPAGMNIKGIKNA
jgi:predicted NAD/FAD-binding protein